ncbi:MAG: hypothetical protein NTV49_00895 [Kiritimatiellaeota bacterium]|nr:hypothetical protein [Kiritimatiellota bacterium]
MKCKMAVRQLLLDQPDEQTAWQQRRLERHLADCADCRAQRAEWRELTAAARAAALPPLAAATRQRIMDAGRRALAERGPSARFRRVVSTWQPALAAAAVLLLLVGGLRLATKSRSNADWDDSVDQQLEHIGQTLAALSSDGPGIRDSVPDEAEPTWDESPEPEEQII